MNTSRVKLLLWLGYTPEQIADALARAKIAGENVEDLIARIYP